MALAISTTPSILLGQEVTYNGSLQLTSGDYIFNERTYSLYLFNGLSVSIGSFQFSANLPLIKQNTPWVSYSSTGAIPTGGPQSNEVSKKGHGERVVLYDSTDYQEIGLGDLFIQANWRLMEEVKALPSISLTAGFKVPLADVEDGFGTGEFDNGAGVSISKALSICLAIIDLSYWRLGDLTGLELKDAFVYSLAIGRPIVNRKLNLLVSFSGCSEVIDDAGPSAQIGLGLAYYLDSGPNLNGSVALGVTDSAPDFSVSLGWGIKL